MHKRVKLNPSGVILIYHMLHTLQNITCIMHTIFSYKAVEQLSFAQLQQVELCCFLLRIGLFLGRRVETATHCISK